MTGSWLKDTTCWLRARAIARPITAGCRNLPDCPLHGAPYRWRAIVLDSLTCGRADALSIAASWEGDVLVAREMRESGALTLDFVLPPAARSRAHVVLHATCVFTPLLYDPSGDPRALSFRVLGKSPDRLLVRAGAVG